MIQEQTPKESGKPLTISVVTAVRNGAAEIRSTLESVAGQSYRWIEHVVVDGASTDGTGAIVGQHGERVAKFISEPDRGVYDAFDKGLRLATGDVVAYLNAGDIYSSKLAIQHVADRFMTMSGVGAVLGDVDIVDAEYRNRVVRRYRCAGFSPDRLASGFMPAHPALFVRRSVYETIGGYDRNYRIAGDFEFCVRAFAIHRVDYSHLDEVLVRMPRGGLSTSGWRSKWFITQEMRRACAQHGIKTSYARLLSRLPKKAMEAMRRD